MGNYFKWWIRKDVEGSLHGLFVGVVGFSSLPQHLLLAPQEVLKLVSQDGRPLICKTHHR